VAGSGARRTRVERPEADVLVDADAVVSNEGPPFRIVAKPPANAEPDVATFGAPSEKFTDSEPCANPVKVTSFACAWPTKPSVQASAKEVA
jgi:hypothetical protein